MARRPAAAAADSGLPHQLIVSTCFDTGVERAFEAAGEELDVVVYVAPAATAASSCTRARRASARRRRAERLRRARAGGAHGAPQDPRPRRPRRTRERESFVVSEDDHIDYLVGGDAAGAVPVQLAARLRRSHLLFLGYAVDDWSLRVFLRRVWGDDRLAYRSWAVQPAAEPSRASSGASAAWRSTTSRSTTYAEELARLTAALAALDAAR